MFTNICPNGMPIHNLVSVPVRAMANPIAAFAALRFATKADVLTIGDLTVHLCVSFGTLAKHLARSNMYGLRL